MFESTGSVQEMKIILVTQKEETCVYVVGEGKREMQVHGTALHCGPVKRGKLHEEVGGPLKKGLEVGQQEGRRKRGKCTEQ